MLDPDFWFLCVPFVYFNTWEVISVVDSSRHKVLHPLTLEVKANHALTHFIYAALTSSAGMNPIRKFAFTVSSLCSSFLLLLGCSEDVKSACDY